MVKERTKHEARESLIYYPLMIDEFVEYLMCLDMKQKDRDYIESFITDLVIMKHSIVKDLHDGQLDPEDYLDLNRYYENTPDKQYSK